MEKKRISLREIAWTFLVIGTTGFGGGLAVIAMMQDLLVVKKRWLELEEFSHGVAFSQILGAFVVNTTTFVGYRLRGLAGAITAVVSFLTPSVVIVIIIGKLYFKYHQLPALQSALNGIGPVVVALMISAAWQMGKPKLKKVEPILISIITMLAVYFLHIPIFWAILMSATYGVSRIYILPERRNHEE